jgi:hypothetical protein
MSNVEGMYSVHFIKKRQSVAIPAFDILRFIILRFDILCKKFYGSGISK